MGTIQPEYLNEEVLCSFGFGDGGGGPTKDMLENQRRLAKGLPGMPRTKMSTAKEFFHVLDKHVTDKKYLPTWVGELYLEYHRGTYTSMARNKKFNRKAEFAYQNEEMYAMLDAQTAGGAYPEKELHEAGRSSCVTSSTIFCRDLRSKKYMMIPKLNMKESLQRIKH